MKILLIKTEITTPIDWAVCSPLGILYLASIAEKMGHEVRVVNLQVLNTKKCIRSLFENNVEWQPDIIGLSASSPFAGIFRHVAFYCRYYCPDALLVGGGAYPVSEYRNILRNGIVDICALGEGEVTFSKLLQSYESGSDFSSVPGVAFVQDGEIKTGPPVPLIHDLDSIPFPAWHLLNFKEYRHQITMSTFTKTAATMFSSRGCPFRCNYCHNTFGKNFRFRSPENVLDEIHLLRSEYGIKNIEFVDDCFNFKKERAKTILRGIRDNFKDVSIAFPNGLRGDMLDEETIRLLKEANCWHVSIAIETVSKQRQKAIGKNLNLEKIKTNLSLLKKHQVYTRAFLMIGFPDESLQEVQKTLDFSLSPNISHSCIFVVAPYNDSGLREMCNQEKLRNILNNIDNFNYNWGDMTLSDIPIEELEKIKNQYFRKGMFRIRNARLLLSTLYGLIRRVLTEKDPYIIASAMMSILGQRKGTKRERMIHRRQLLFRQVKQSLLVDAYNA